MNKFAKYHLTQEITYILLRRSNNPAWLNIQTVARFQYLSTNSITDLRKSHHQSPETYVSSKFIPQYASMSLFEINPNHKV